MEQRWFKVGKSSRFSALPAAPAFAPSGDFDFERPKADLTARVQVPLPFKQADLEVFDYPAGYAQQAQVDSFVKSRLTCAYLANSSYASK